MSNRKIVATNRLSLKHFIGILCILFASCVPSRRTVDLSDASNVPATLFDYTALGDAFKLRAEIEITVYDSLSRTVNKEGDKVAEAASNGPVGPVTGGMASGAVGEGKTMYADMIREVRLAITQWVKDRDSATDDAAGKKALTRFLTTAVNLKAKYPQLVLPIPNSDAITVIENGRPVDRAKDQHGDASK